MKTVWGSLLTLAVALTAAVAIDGRSAFSDDGAKGGNVKLERLNWKKFQERLVAGKGVKYTLVDVWLTTCGPCKENFPHLVALHHKFGEKGLAVISLSFDDPTDQVAVAEAEKFLKEKNAEFTNILLDESVGEGYEKLNISSIPAVIVYGPDGKEAKRFTMDDPCNQFTYDEVEKAIAGMLGGK